MPEGKPAKAPAAQVTLHPCLHDATYLAPQPKQGETVYCRRCQKYRTVKRAEEIWYRCQNCRVAKRCGQDGAGAIRGGSRHVLKHPSHVVHVVQAGTTLRVIATPEVQEHLVSVPTDIMEAPYESVLSDRRALSKDLQAMLRPKD